ncbi:right-handed parallel beta-helix repeat-containing protein, partial [Sphingomonas bacterium]|uniref:right-handed parallel beta-helix repeat-containing protein n=1 Tax=Sphingomonas bacterium TaxID=1895847 RepID=UPI001577103A
LPISRPVTPGDTGGRPAPSGARAIDLGALPIGGLVRRGAYVHTAAAGIELFQGGDRLVPSRWPASGYATGSVAGANAAGPTVSVPGNHASAWRGEPSLWAGGYWGADWAFELAPVALVAPGGAAIKLAPLQGQQPPRATARFFVENALSELHRPGSFVVDGKRRVAIFLPTGNAPVEAAVARSLLVFQGARNVAVSGIAFDRTLGPAVQVNGSTDIRFAACAFRQTGGNGVTVSGGRNVTFTGSVIASTAETGIVLGGGDRPSLTPAGHVFANGVITDFGLESPSYRPGANLQGDGNQLRGSYIAGGDHNAVMLSGNDHIVSGNEIANVLRDAEDSGAIYMGADWTQRGMEISGNYVHDIGGTRPTNFLTSVYLDDQFSGAHVAGNVLVGGDYGVVIAGGRDNRVEHNLIVDPRRGGIHFDARGLGKQANRTVEFAAKLARVPAMSPAWLARYPALRTLTQDRYGTPDGDIAGANLVLGAPVVVADPPSVAAMLSVAGNTGSILPVSPGPSALPTMIGRVPGGATPPLADRARDLAALMPLREVPDR